MEHYLINSTICLLTFYGFYYFFLAREKMNHLNRIYLLLAVIISGIIPILSIKKPTTISTKIWSNQEIVGNFAAPNNNWIEPSTYDLSNLIYWIYGFITLIIAVKFFYNLSKLLHLAHLNKKIKYQNATIVLLEFDQIPFSFLNYIFINKAEYNNDNIEEDILIHECTHVQQLHSLDIIFIELVQVVLWFNPLIYLFKKAIQINHEYLADESVIRTSDKINSYQELILEKISVNNQLRLTSNFNYSLTKKRFKMMKKTTSQIQMWARSFFILPITLCLLFACSKQSIAQSNELPSDKMEEYKKIVQELYPADKKIYKFHKEKYDKLNELYKKMSEAQQLSIKTYKEQIIPTPPVPPAPSANPVPPAPPSAPTAPSYTNSNSNITIPPPPPLTKKQLIKFIDTDVKFYLDTKRLKGDEILNYFDRNKNIPIMYYYENDQSISIIRFYPK